MRDAPRRITIVLAVLVLGGLLATPATAQEPVEVEGTIDEYTDIGEVDLGREDDPDVDGVVLDRGTPAEPAEVLGVQQRLAVTGGDLAILAGLGLLVLALGAVIVRSGRRRPARR
jgi:hypothetical protein